MGEAGDMPAYPTFLPDSRVDEGHRLAFGPLMRTYHEPIYTHLYKSCSPGAPLMPEIIAEPPLPSCYHLFPRPEIQESQQLGPDPFLPHVRDARGRFAKGSSGNPRGRPRGIANPRRRAPDLVARPLSAQALSDLLDRKPHLLRPLAAQLLPPPLASIDPTEPVGGEPSRLTFYQVDANFNKC